MKNPDLTIIYLTASEINEDFAKEQRQLLLEAAGNYPIISVSRKPLDFGLNIIDDGKRCSSNIYQQMLRAAKIAKTDYIAVAEDDTLYCKEHFTCYRPEKDTFAYNQHRVALFTWGRPTYSWRNRKSNCSLIAPRKLLIKALEERFAKYPNGTPPKHTGELGRERIEKKLGLKHYNSIEVYSKYAIIQFNHDTATEERQVNHKKRMGPIRFYDMPYWGRARDIVKKYKK
jgi:hypothetical protein